MKKVLIIHPRLRPGGGSEARPLWIAEALKKEYEVTLLTQGKIDLPKLNKAYGTSLRDGEVIKIELSPWPFLFNQLDAYRSIPLVRTSQKLVPQFDVLISTYNILDFKKKGIQFIADFSFSDQLRRKFHPSSNWWAKVIYEFPLWRVIYLKLAQWLSRTTSGWRKNLTVANSKWTQKVLKQYFNLEAEVIYPPVVTPEGETPWEDREEGFIILGRITPEKKIDEMIEIVKAVRERLSNKSLHLHLIGGAERRYYLKKLKLKVATYPEWLFWEGPLYGELKFELLRQHKFGLHGRAFEPFGIAIAEMVKSGCLVWVPAEGGQTEIVDHPWLIYNSPVEAVEKITTVLSNYQLQKELRVHLKAQAFNFSTERFQSEVRNLVSRFLNNG